MTLERGVLDENKGPQREQRYARSGAVANGVREAVRTKLKMPVLAVGGKDNERQMREVSEECPEELAQVYLDFFREEANA